MALTSSSTLSDALAQYNDNLSWDGDAAKAAAALEAIRWLLINRASSIATEGESANYESLKSEKERLERYLGAVDVSNQAVFVQGRPQT